MKSHIRRNRKAQEMIKMIVMVIIILLMGALMLIALQQNLLGFG